VHEWGLNGNSEVGEVMDAFVGGVAQEPEGGALLFREAVHRS
jgi:hypothetical protein